MEIVTGLNHFLTQHKAKKSSMGISFIGLEKSANHNQPNHLNIQILALLGSPL